MDINIRNEMLSDFQRSEEVARNAFWNLYKEGAEEHFVLKNMRNHIDFIPELSFVIEVNGKIEGGIFYTHSHILSPIGEKIPTITFGPVFISPEHHRKSLGRKMITHSLEKAKQMDYLGVLTLGYTYHYKPYGFLGGKKYGISMEDGNYYTGLLALPLKDNAFEGASGMAVFSDVFAVNPEKLEEYDKQFPHKEKKVEESQKEFELACSQLDLS